MIEDRKQSLGDILLQGARGVFLGAFYLLLGGAILRLIVYLVLGA